MSIAEFFFQEEKPIQRFLNAGVIVVEGDNMLILSANDGEQCQSCSAVLN